MVKKIYKQKIFKNIFEDYFVINTCLASTFSTSKRSSANIGLVKGRRATVGQRNNRGVAGFTIDDRDCNLLQDARVGRSAAQ